MQAFSRIVVATVAIHLLAASVQAADFRDTDPIDCAGYWCPAMFTASIDSVWLQRGRPKNVPIYTTGGGANILNASDFVFDFEPGVDLTIGFRTPDVALEGRYLWVNTWQDAAGPLTISGGDFFHVNPPLFILAPYTVSPTYFSQFESAEMNYRGTVLPWLQVLAGVRYARFGESYRASYTLGTMDFRAGNDLIGFQAGTDVLVREILPGLRVSSSCKMGIYYNNANSRVELTEATTILATGTRARVSFLGELDILLSYQMGPRWSLRFGYRWLCLDGVATAANQIPNTSYTLLPLSLTSLTDPADTVFFHGFTGGLEYRF